MVSSARLLLQCNQLRDLIKEQHRLALLELDPSEQEQDDLMSLLDAIHSGLERLDGVEKVEVHREFEKLLDSLAEIDIDSKAYRTELPKTKATVTNDEALRQPPLLSAVKASQPELTTGFTPPGKKTVRFSDVNEERYTEPYRDVPMEQTNGQIYDMNEELMLDQDRRLGQLGKSVRTQHAMSLEIDSEVSSQVAFLDDLEAQTDRSHSRLHNASERVGVFNRKAREHGSCVTILVLVLILFILLVIL